MKLKGFAVAAALILLLGLPMIASAETIMTGINTESTGSGTSGSTGPANAGVSDGGSMDLPGGTTVTDDDGELPSSDYDPTRAIPYVPLFPMPDREEGDGDDGPVDWGPAVQQTNEMAIPAGEEGAEEDTDGEDSSTSGSGGDDSEEDTGEDTTGETTRDPGDDTTDGTAEPADDTTDDNDVPVSSGGIGTTTGGALGNLLGGASGCVPWDEAFLGLNESEQPETDDMQVWRVEIDDAGTLTALTDASAGDPIGFLFNPVDPECLPRAAIDQIRLYLAGLPNGLFQRDDFIAYDDDSGEGNNFSAEDFVLPSYIYIVVYDDSASGGFPDLTLALDTPEAEDAGEGETEEGGEEGEASETGETEADEAD